MTLQRTVFIVLLLCFLGISANGLAAGAGTALSCPDLPAAACLARLEKAYGVTVRSNIDLTGKNVSLEFQQATPLEAVKAVYNALGISNYAAAFDKKSNQINVTLIGGADQFVPAAVAAPLALSPSPAVPALEAGAAGDGLPAAALAQDGAPSPIPEEWQAIAARASQAPPEDLDAPIVLPGSESQPVTLRYLRSLQERAAVQDEHLDEPVLPADTKAGNITLRQLREKVAEASRTPAPEKTVVPGGGAPWSTTP